MLSVRLFDRQPAPEFLLSPDVSIYLLVVCWTFFIRLQDEQFQHLHSSGHAEARHESVCRDEHSQCGHVSLGGWILDFQKLSGAPSRQQTCTWRVHRVPLHQTKAEAFDLVPEGYYISRQIVFLNGRPTKAAQIELSQRPDRY